MLNCTKNTDVFKYTLVFVIRVKYFKFSSSFASSYQFGLNGSVQCLVKKYQCAFGLFWVR